MSTHKGTEILLSASALFMAGLGVLASFLPQEILAWPREASPERAPVSTFQ